MKIEKKCVNTSCGKNFLSWPSANKLYCSRECSYTRLIGENNPSKKEEVRKKISISLKGREITWGDKVSKALKTSDKAKVQQFKSGEDNIAYGKGDLQKGLLNPNWKGGVTTKNQLIRNSDKYVSWRKICMERDNYKCTDCGVGGYLQVHHIKELAKYPELAYVVDNGKTVCISCHQKIHGTTYGKLTNKQVKEIKLIFKDKIDITLEKIALKYEVSLSTINNIKHNKTWKNIII
jgi:hypothetical protein